PGTGSAGRGSSAFLAVQPVTQKLAGLEEGNVLFLYLDRVAGARIAPRARIAFLDRERPEAAQFHPVAPGHRLDDFLKDRVHDLLDVALEQMRVFFGDLGDQFGSDHVANPPRVPRANPPGVICPTIGRKSRGTNSKGLE